MRKKPLNAFFESTQPVTPHMMMDEKTVWRGHPSQIVYLDRYIILCFVFLLACILSIAVSGFFFLFALYAIGRAGYLYLEVRNWEYIFTNQRLIRRVGLINRVTKEIELYRVKDVHLHETFFLRLFGKGEIRLATSQANSPVIFIKAIDDSARLREVIRTHVERRRTEKGVTEVDMDYSSKFR